MMASSTDLASALTAELSRADFSPDAAAAAGYRALWSPQLRLQRDFQVFGGEFLGEQQVTKLRGFFTAFFKLEMDVWGGFLAGWPGLPGNENHEVWNKRLQFGLALFIRFPPEVALALMVTRRRAHACAHPPACPPPPPRHLPAVTWLPAASPDLTPPSPPIQVRAVTFSLEYGPALLRSFLSPLFGPYGGPPPYEYRMEAGRLKDVYVVGDEPAKQEALQMMGRSSAD